MIELNPSLHRYRNLLQVRLAQVRDSILTKDPLSAQGQKEILLAQGQCRLIMDLLHEKTIEEIFA